MEHVWILHVNTEFNEAVMVEAVCQKSPFCRMNITFTPGGVA
jgi:hypothetical protein